MVTENNTSGYTWAERLAIRHAYSEIPDEYQGKITPYIFDVKLSPLESMAWNSIRYFGQTCHFRPEYPIDKYFADFADPINKIVIEVDGKQFHKDKEKDSIRQKEIEALGWYVIRFDHSQINSMIFYSIRDKFELEEIDQDEFLRLVEKNKYNCIDCFFNSREFKGLVKYKK